MKKLMILLSTLLLTACLGMPKQVQPVNNFQLERYLGTWYEIARLDHSFERGLSHVSANYSLLPNGQVRVLNRGYSEQKQAWKDIEGKAAFVQTPNIGHLKVSFFGPFYSSYVITDLDESYQYALISGYNHSYLWILARQPQIPDAVKQRLIAKAQSLGFDTRQLIFVQHASPK